MLTLCRPQHHFIHNYTFFFFLLYFSFIDFIAMNSTNVCGWGVFRFSTMYSYGIQLITRCLAHKVLDICKVTITNFILHMFVCVYMAMSAKCFEGYKTKVQRKIGFWIFCLCGSGDLVQVFSGFHGDFLQFLVIAVLISWIHLLATAKHKFIIHYLHV